MNAFGGLIGAAVTGALWLSPGPMGGPLKYLGMVAIGVAWGLFAFWADGEPEVSHG